MKWKVGIIAMLGLLIVSTVVGAYALKHGRHYHSFKDALRSSVMAPNKTLATRLLISQDGNPIFEGYVSLEGWDRKWGRRGLGNGVVNIMVSDAKNNLMENSGRISLRLESAQVPELQITQPVDGYDTGARDLEIE